MSTKTTPAAASQPSLWVKAMDRNAEWTKDELMDVIFYIRFALAAVSGIIWGILGITGAPGLLGFPLVSLVSIWFYTAKYLGYEDEPDQRKDIAMEAFFSSFAFFLLFWIIVHTALRG
eukprot:EC724049.1.p1 GENE.EC724049.1~~EC724049.1.p1  ORF type:complete len:118 (+),score=21.26 EC724049.1:68-421(+)